MSLFANCQGCGGDRGEALPTTTRFVGGIHALLCCACTTAVDRAILAADLWRQMKAADADVDGWLALATGGTRLDTSELRAAYERRCLLEVDLGAFVLAQIVTLHRNPQEKP